MSLQGLRTATDEDSVLCHRITDNQLGSTAASRTPTKRETTPTRSPTSAAATG